MAVASVSVGPRGHRGDIFASVFPPNNFTTPTPEATPNIGVLSSPAKSFGGFSQTNQAADGAVTFNRTWSTATRFLSLSVGDNATHDDRHAVREAAAAIQFLWDSVASQSELLKWYTNETGVHFRELVLPSLDAWQRPIPSSEASNILDLTIRTLESAQEHYNKPFFTILRVVRDANQRHAVESFCLRMRQNIHRLILHSLPRQRLQKTLANVMYQLMETSLQANYQPRRCLKSAECPLRTQPGQAVAGFATNRWTRRIPG